MLFKALGSLEDKARGVRHPFAGIVLLTLLGMQARIREMEVLVRWARANRDELKEPLPTTLPGAPTAAYGCSVRDFAVLLTTHGR